MATQAPPAHGTFCWNELLTRDVDAASSFYTTLFGWSVEEMDMGPAGTYHIMKAGDTQVGGIMKLPAPEAPPCWLSYIAVDDVDAHTEKAKGLGATVCCEPTDIPNIGRFAVITDPTGATVALFTGAPQC